MSAFGKCGSRSNQIFESCRHRTTGRSEDRSRQALFSRCRFPKSRGCSAIRKSARLRMHSRVGPEKHPNRSVLKPLLNLLGSRAERFVVSTCPPPSAVSRKRIPKDREHGPRGHGVIVRVPTSSGVIGAGQWRIVIALFTRNLRKC